MVNPLLTIVFDLFLVGSALLVSAALVDEYLASRSGAVRGGARNRTASRRVIRHAITGPKDFRSEVARLQARRPTRVRAA